MCGARGGGGGEGGKGAGWRRGVDARRGTMTWLFTSKKGFAAPKETSKKTNLMLSSARPIYLVFSNLCDK